MLAVCFMFLYIFEFIRLDYPFYFSLKFLNGGSVTCFPAKRYSHDDAGPVRPVSFHQPIKRLNLKLFSDSSRKVALKKDSMSRSIETNRSIRGCLLAVSTRAGQVIDFHKALKYPLSSVPLSLANPDGRRRATTESKLQSIILDHFSIPISHPRENSSDKSIVNPIMAGRGHKVPAAN